MSTSWTQDELDRIGAASPDAASPDAATTAASATS
jgi:hypothetical protein